MDKATHELFNIISKNEGIPQETKLLLMEALHEMPSVLQTDRWIYRMVVLFLGSTVTLTVLGGIYVIIHWGGGTEAKTLPEGVIALGSAAVGALAGLLAPSPVGRQ